MCLASDCCRECWKLTSNWRPLQQVARCFETGSTAALVMVVLAQKVRMYLEAVGRAAGEAASVLSWAEVEASVELACARWVHSSSHYSLQS